jgi:phosphoesterase RecJ-like protein
VTAGAVTIHELLPARPATRTDGTPFTSGAAAFAVVDTGSWSQLAEMRPVLQGHADRTVLIDHHLHGDADVAALRLIDPRCASATQALAPVCCLLAGVEAPCSSRLPLPVARALYLGLATDTGWLRYSSVTPATLRLAADLLEAGVDHTALYRLIEQQDEPARWRLLGRALGTLELHGVRAPGDVAVMTLTAADFAATGASRNDTNGFADMVLTVASVEVSVVLTEQDPAPGEGPVTKLSFRSKPGPNAVDVNALAQTLGGGGHARAAGGKVKAGLAETKRRLLESMRRKP